MIAEIPLQKLIVKETIYWQSRGSKAQSVPSSFVRLSISDEVPYVRPRLRVGEEWQSLDTGYLKTAGMVVIENILEVCKTIPTPEQAMLARAKILEIAVTRLKEIVPFCHVPVGEDHRFTPPMGSVDGFVMRCIKGETRVNITAFPGGSSGG